MRCRDSLTAATAAAAMAAVIAAALLGSVTSRTARADTPDPLVAMFVWWNGAYKQNDGFTAESFSRYFTPDAVMRETAVPARF